MHQTGLRSRSPPSGLARLSGEISNHNGDREHVRHRPFRNRLDEKQSAPPAFKVRLHYRPGDEQGFCEGAR